MKAVWSRVIIACCLLNGIVLIATLHTLSRVHGDATTSVPLPSRRVPLPSNGVPIGTAASEQQPVTLQQIQSLLEQHTKSIREEVAAIVRSTNNKRDVLDDDTLTNSSSHIGDFHSLINATHRMLSRAHLYGMFLLNRTSEAAEEAIDASRRAAALSILAAQANQYDPLTEQPSQAVGGNTHKRRRSLSPLSRMLRELDDDELNSNSNINSNIKSRDDDDDDTMLFFMHIPKTAGTSLSSSVRRSFDEDEFVHMWMDATPLSEYVKNFEVVLLWLCLFVVVLCEWMLLL